MAGEQLVGSRAAQATPGAPEQSAIWSPVGAGTSAAVPKSILPNMSGEEVAEGSLWYRSSAPGETRSCVWRPHKYCDFVLNDKPGGRAV